jgi:hypothetical protein
MDAFSVLPRITVSELQTRAGGFAKELVENLEKINRDSNTVLTPEAQKYVESLPAEQFSHPLPADYRHVFESVFCRFMASHYIIVPDKE